MPPFLHDFLKYAEQHRLSLGNLSNVQNNTMDLSDLWII
jgi:hypothetical protein